MKQLEQVLAEVSEEKLRYAYQLWAMGDINTARLKTLVKRIPDLVEREKDAVAVRFVWEKLSEDQRQVFNQLVGVEARKGVPYEKLRQRNSWTDEKLRAVVRSLVDAALIGEETRVTAAKGEKNTKVEQETTMFFPFKENAILLYEVTREVQVSPSEYSTLDLNEVLEPLSLAQLQSMVGKHGVGYYSYTTRAQAMALIRQMLFDLEIVYEVISKLDTPARDLFTWLCEGKGMITVQEVRERTGFDDPTLFKTIHRLTDTALAFDRLSNQGRILFIPKEVQEPLKKALKLFNTPTPEPGLITVETPEFVIEGKTFIQYDLAIIIGAAYQQVLEPTQGGYVPKRIAAKIQPLLHGFPRYSYNDEDQYMEMLFEIARELQLLQLSNPALQDVKSHYEEGKALAEWTSLSLAEQTRHLLAQWLKSFRWQDIISDDYHQYDSYSWHPLGARPVLKKYLQDCIPGRWYSTTSLLETIWQEEPLALRKSQYSQGFYDMYSPFPQVKPGITKGPAGRARWMSSDAQAYLAALTSSLLELGIITLGGEKVAVDEETLAKLGELAQEEGVTGEREFIVPRSFMVTELGTAALASGTKASEGLTATTQSLVVQPNFELLLLSPAMPTLYQLLPFAQIKQVDMVSTLVINRNSVLRGLAHGKTFEQILDTLRLYSQKDLPQNVEYSIRDWTKQYKGVRLTQTILLETSDESLADELCSSKSFKSFGLRKLGPLAIAASGDINAIRRALDKEGINVNITGVGSAKRDYTYSGR